MSGRRDHVPENSDGEESLTGTVGMPRWVKAFLITTAALLLLVLAAMLISGGDHGPGRHLSGTHASEASVQQSHIVSALPQRFP